MKPFDLAAAKAGAQVMTRSGRPARIVCWNMADSLNPIVGLVKDRMGVEHPYPYADDGHYFGEGDKSTLDLVMATDEEGNFIY